MGLVATETLVPAFAPPIPSTGAVSETLCQWDSPGSWAHGYLQGRHQTLLTQGRHQADSSLRFLEVLGPGPNMLMAAYHLPPSSCLLPSSLGSLPCGPCPPLPLGPQVLPGLGGLPPGPRAAEGREESECRVPGHYFSTIYLPGALGVGVGVGVSPARS